MTRSLAVTVCLLSAMLVAMDKKGSVASAQEPQAATKASSIAGTVVKEPGSEPLKKALVQVVAENQQEGANYTASTDADGHFRVENVPPGRYSIFIERTGFIGVNERGLKTDTNVVTVQDGQSIEGLLFRMLPTAIITGHVTDEDGDPMSGVNVVAQKKRPGKATRENVASATTNDLGEYRLSGLFPGQHWVVAMPPPDFRDYEQPHHTSHPDKSQPDAASDDKPEQPKSDTRYLTTYYPGTYDALQAAAVTLKAGDEMPVNFALVPAKTYRIRGIVTGITSNQKANVELISKAGDSYRANATEIGSDGQFEVRGVGPGSYVLRASAGSESQLLTARQDISVVAADVEGVKLVPQSSFTISGNLRIWNARGNLTQYAVNLRPAEVPDDPGFFISQDSLGANAAVDRFGHFEWKSVNPGNYLVQVVGGDGQGFFLKSATMGGQDIAAGFTASGPAELDLVVSTKGGIIEGVVVEREKNVDNNYPVANATVVAVPEEKYRKLPDRFLTGETDQHGRFTLRGVAPGSYTLYAWQDVDDDVYRDPNFLKSQEANGTAVKVEEGSDQKFELKLSSVDEEWR
ncbi:MAG: carboxypeptidase regulatory-like domain-containing protein [Terriglobales bacterium]